MRIMQLISGQGVNGAVLQCQALVRALCARGHDVTLVCRPDSWTSQQYDNFPAVRLETNRLRRWSVGDLRRVAGWVRERQ
ncbi:MAG: glycosyltransferase, partial [Pirellulaceae bacterium]